MRVLLDECLPKRLTRELIGHDVRTVPEAGWAGRKNGELLQLIPGRFEVFITIDQNLVAQQKVAVLQRDAGGHWRISRLMWHRASALAPKISEE